jgi:hypothetical protein
MEADEYDHLIFDLSDYWYGLAAPEPRALAPLLSSRPYIVPWNCDVPGWLIPRHAPVRRPEALMEATPIPGMIQTLAHTWAESMRRLSLLLRRRLARPP